MGDKWKPKNKHNPVTLLQMKGYNLENLMGTALRERQNFTTLRGIRDAYTSAFSKRFEKIKSVLDDPAIDVLAITRNLIVHRGGACDQEYAYKSKQFKNSLRLARGEKLLLDGAKILKIIPPAIKCGISLISEVDLWITANPQKKRKLTT
jgi:hypothetical protein